MMPQAVSSPDDSVAAKPDLEDDRRGSQAESVEAGAGSIGGIEVVGKAAINRSPPASSPTKFFEEVDRLLHNVDTDVRGSPLRQPITAPAPPARRPPRSQVLPPRAATEEETPAEERLQPQF